MWFTCFRRLASVACQVGIPMLTRDNSRRMLFSRRTVRYDFLWEERMASLPNLSESEIQRWVGESSFTRSRSYVGRAIFNPRRTGSTLKAQCAGSAPQPYHVKATLSEDSIAAASCSVCLFATGGMRARSSPCPSRHRDSVPTFLHVG